jgi:hypothetical protein
MILLAFVFTASDSFEDSEASLLRIGNGQRL